LQCFHVITQYAIMGNFNVDVQCLPSEFVIARYRDSFL
jgi:hypothetical protein